MEEELHIDCAVNKLKVERLGLNGGFCETKPGG